MTEPPWLGDARRFGPNVLPRSGHVKGEGSGGVVNARRLAYASVRSRGLADKAKQQAVHDQTTAPRVEPRPFRRRRGRPPPIMPRPDRPAPRHDARQGAVPAILLWLSWGGWPRRGQDLPPERREPVRQGADGPVDRRLPVHRDQERRRCSRQERLDAGVEEPAQRPRDLGHRLVRPDAGQALTWPGNGSHERSARHTGKEEASRRKTSTAWGTRVREEEER